MKKIICFLSIIALIVTFFAGCGKTAKSLTFEEFYEKYKRADYEELLKDASGFVNDYFVIDYSTESTLEMVKDWKKDDYERYIQNDVLYNKSVIFKGVLSEDEESVLTIFIEFDTGNKDQDYEIAKTITRAMFDKFGEPKSISIDNENSNVPSSESILRKMFDSDEEYYGFNVEFSDLHHARFHLSENDSIGLIQSGFTFY